MNLKTEHNTVYKCISRYLKDVHTLLNGFQFFLKEVKRYKIHCGMRVEDITKLNDGVNISSFQFRKQKRKEPFLKVHKVLGTLSCSDVQVA